MTTRPNASARLSQTAALTVIQPSKRKAPGDAAECNLRRSEIRTARPNSSFCLGIVI